MNLNRPVYPEYCIATGWKIFIFATCTLLFIPFGYITYATLFEPSANMPAWYFLPLGLGGIAFLVYALVRTFREKLILGHDRFIHVQAFTQKELLYINFEGFRFDEKFIYFLSAGRTIIKISTSVRGKNELLARLPGYNLDYKDRYEEHKKLLSNTDYGYLEQHIQSKLTRTRRICKWVNIIVPAVCLWVVFYPYPYMAAMLFTLITPLAVIIVVKLSRGFIKLNEHRNDAHPNLTGSFLMPLLALALRVLFDFDIHQFNDLWLTSVAVFIVIAGTLFSGGTEFNFSTKDHRGASIALIAFIYVYALTGCIAINCMFDMSAPQKYRVTVSQKRTEFKKSMTYYLAISPWGPVTESCEESVLKEVYDRVKPGDQVIVYYRKGLLSASWYNIR